MNQSVRRLGVPGLCSLVLLLGGCPGTSGGDEGADVGPDSGPEMGEPDTGDDADVLDGGGGDVAADAVDMMEDLPPPGPDLVKSPTLLSQTGLFTDIVAKKTAPDLIEFGPDYILWSDAADKKRWVRIPPGTQINTEDMDHWDFPIGTQFFKEFSLDGVRIETRLIQKIDNSGIPEFDFFLGSFIWNDDETEAELSVEGAFDVKGTILNVPAQARCSACHRGDPGHILGFSAIQLARGINGKMTTALLSKMGLLSHPPTKDYVVPGDEATQNAMGYLHANCGHCHNQLGAAWEETDMDLRLRFSETSPEATAIYRTTVGVNTQYFMFEPDYQVRVVAGDPDTSAIPYRMMQRLPPNTELVMGAARAPMPPIATEIVDDEGLAFVRAWIASLPPAP